MSKVALEELVNLANNRLNSYGISYKEAPQYGMSVISAEETSQLGPEFQALPALLFRYHSLSGEVIPMEQFFRVRYLKAPSLGGWGAALKAPQRYGQRKGTLNEVYLASIGPGGKKLNWKKIASDSSLPIFITEGEGKGICGCKHGLPTIALGGVNMFTAYSKGVGLLPIFEQIVWRGRQVFIIFDRDTAEGYKPQVYIAAKKLADELLVLGAEVRIAMLPNWGDGKVGLDDYLLKEGVEALQNDILPEASLAYKDFNKLQSIASNYGYIESIDRFLNLGDFKVDTFFKIDHFNRTRANFEVEYPVKTRIRVGASFSIISAPAVLKAGEALLRWPGRQSFQGMVYRPGMARSLTINGETHLNLWQGWKCEYLNNDRLPSPKRREILLKEWFWVLDNIFGDGEMRMFAQHWLHYPIKYPGTKLNTLLMVFSKLQGIGKSFIGHMLAKHVYGVTAPGPAHAWVLKHGEMGREFNRYKMAMSLIVMDEANLSKKKEWYEGIKSDVTEDTSMINRKNVDEFMMEVCQNYYMSCNETIPTFIESYDRRSALHRVDAAEKAPERFAALDKDFASGEAAATVLWWARNRYEEGEFNKTTEAPMSDAKREVVSSGQSDLASWIEDLVKNPELECKVATTEEVLQLYKKEHAEDFENAKWSTQVIGNMLSNAGALRWRNGAYIYYNGGRNRFWVFDRDMKDASKEFILEEVSKPFSRKAEPKEGVPKGEVVKFRGRRKHEK